MVSEEISDPLKIETCVSYDLSWLITTSFGRVNALQSVTSRAISACKSGPWVDLTCILLCDATNE